jgi:hypothetical protein
MRPVLYSFGSIAELTDNPIWEVRAIALVICYQGLTFLRHWLAVGAVHLGPGLGQYTGHGQSPIVREDQVSGISPSHAMIRRSFASS